MSWSRNFTGTPTEVIRQAKAERPQIEASLPEFEKDDVARAIEAASITLEGMPKDAKVALSLAGHGHRDTTGGGGGAVSMSVNYTLAAAGSPAN